MKQVRCFSSTVQVTPIGKFKNVLIPGVCFAEDAATAKAHILNQFMKKYFGEAVTLTITRLKEIPCDFIYEIMPEENTFVEVMEEKE